MGNGCIGKESVAIATPTLPTLKLVVVGESGSGKTSVVRRFAEDEFDEDYTKTDDVDIKSVVKKLNVPNRAIVSVEVWDIPGKNDVDLRKTYYLDVDAVIVVADISSESSLNLAGSWIVDVANHARVSRTFTESVPNPDGKTFSNKMRKEYARPNPGSVPVLLLGNKFDVAKENYLKQLEAENEAEKVDHANGSVTRIPEGDENGDTAEQDATSAEKTDGSKEESVKTIETKDDKDGERDKIKDTETAESGEAVMENGETSNTDENTPEVLEENPTAPDSIKNAIDAENTTEQNVSEEPQPQGGDDESEKATHASEDGKPNGHLSNGDAVKQANGDVKTTTESTDKPPQKFKKIFPKDEKNASLASRESGSLALPFVTPDETKSSVTYATSVASILPPCVEEIEEIAEKYGYLAGVPVSAKTKNGGVQEAVHSLLRRLVAKKLFNLDAQEAIAERKKNNIDAASTMSMKSARSKKSRRIRENSGYEPLQEVGIIEIDEVIRNCNPTLQEAEELTSGYAEALHAFKQECHVNGFTPNARVSLEMCITALKRVVSTNLDSMTSADPRENVRLMLMTPEQQAAHLEPKLNMVVSDKDGFPDLRIVDRNNEDVEEEGRELSDDLVIPERVMTVLIEYREKFLMKSIAIVKYAAEVEAVLAKRTMEVTAKEEKAWETAVSAGLSHEEVRRILATLAQDKARLRGTVEHVRETKKSVQTASGKIKAALLF